MRLSLLAILLLLGACAGEQDARGCEPASSLAEGIVRLDRAQGTAFITKQNELVTVKHVAEALKVSTAWQYIDISQKTRLPFDVWNHGIFRLRLKQVLVSNLAEELYILEMYQPLPWPVSTISLRDRPLREGEAVTGVGYARGQLRFGRGNFLKETRPDRASSRRFAGFKLANAYERHPLTVGSSGGGIFDCRGFLTATIARAHNSDTWGAENVFGVPVHSVTNALLQ